MSVEGADSCGLILLGKETIHDVTDKSLSVCTNIKLHSHGTGRISERL